MGQSVGSEQNLSRSLQQRPARRSPAARPAGNGVIYKVKSPRHKVAERRLGRGRRSVRAGESLLALAASRSCITPGSGQWAVGRRAWPLADAGRARYPGEGRLVPMNGDEKGLQVTPPRLRGIVTRPTAQRSRHFLPPVGLLVLRLCKELGDASPESSQPNTTIDELGQTLVNQFLAR